MGSDLEAKLFQFIGTEHYYRHPLGLLYTDGIKFLAEEAKSYWLIDLIASHQPYLREIEFQLWELDVSQNRTALITAREDTNQPTLVKQDIGYTDFPLAKITLYCQTNVLFLPSEY